MIEYPAITSLLGSFMLQYGLDYYPPFASGCGFVLSRDLVQALIKQELPDYRLLVCPFLLCMRGMESSCFTRVHSKGFMSFCCGTVDIVEPLLAACLEVSRHSFVCLTCGLLCMHLAALYPITIWVHVKVQDLVSSHSHIDHADGLIDGSNCSALFFNHVVPPLPLLPRARILHLVSTYVAQISASSLMDLSYHNMMIGCAPIEASLSSSLPPWSNTTSLLKRWCPTISRCWQP